MPTEIKTWQITDGVPRPLRTKLADGGRTEAGDLEEWLTTDPTVIADGILVFGRQVRTKSGPLDLLAIDASGAVIIIELKRERLQRDAIAQAIDYASDIAGWTLEELSEECVKYLGVDLEDAFADAFPDADPEGITINSEQRMVLVGFGLDPALERMIEWLSEAFGVAVNAVLLQYVRTSSGDELLTRTSVISEEAERTRSKRRSFKMPMSDEPGSYPEGELRMHLRAYLDRDAKTVRAIRDIIIPMSLEGGVVTRDELKAGIVEEGLADESKAWHVAAAVSNQFGYAKNDFLRQLIAYEYPNRWWEKDNYRVRDQYRDLARELIEEVGDTDGAEVFEDR